MSFDKHVSNVVRSSYIRVRALKQVMPPFVTVSRSN